MLSAILTLTFAQIGLISHICLAAAQDVPPNTETEGSSAPQISESAADDAEARAFFEKLVQAQAEEDNLPTIQGFGMRLGIRDFDPKGSHEGILDIYYRNDRGGSMRMVLDDSKHGTRVSKGFDAAGYWLREDDGELIGLESKDYQLDREQIDQIMTQCDDFLLLFDLRRLLQGGKNLQLKSTEQQTILSGKMRRGDEYWGFQLRVPKGEPLPSMLSLQAPNYQVLPADPALSQSVEPQEPITVTPEPQHYMLGDWHALEGRFLPSWIDEFRGNDLENPLRSLEIMSFGWRNLERIRTQRPELLATAPPTGSQDRQKSAKH
jgi:hypothetical protein